MSSLEILRNGYKPKRSGIEGRDKRLLTFEELINRSKRNKMTRISKYGSMDKEQLISFEIRYNIFIIFIKYRIILSHENITHHKLIIMKG